MYFDKQFLTSHACMLGFAILVSGSFPIGTVVAGSIDPVSLTFMRFLMASVLLGGFLMYRSELQRHYFERPWRFILLGGSFSFYFVFMFEALKTASPVATSSIFTLMPFFALCLDRLFFAKRASRHLVFYLVLGACGTLLVVFKGSLQNLIFLRLDYGELVFFAGTAIHAAYAVLMPRLRSGEPASFVTFAVMAAASLVLFVMFPGKILATKWLELPTKVYLSLIYLSVFASILTLTLLTIASARLSSGHFTAYTFTTPFWVALIDYLVFGTALESYLIFGGILILVSLVLLFKKSGSRAVAPKQKVRAQL